MTGIGKKLHSIVVQYNKLLEKLNFVISLHPNLNFSRPPIALNCIKLNMLKSTCINILKDN